MAHEHTLLMQVPVPGAQSAVQFATVKHSTWQSASQPSPAVVPPSSHASPSLLSTTPSPQLGSTDDAYCSSNGVTDDDSVDNESVTVAWALPPGTFLHTTRLGD